MTTTSVNETASLVVSAISIIGVIFLIYKYFREPDIKADKELALLQQGCTIKHGTLDKEISDINKSITFIKENHLSHIEASLKTHDEKFVMLFTMLDERLPKRNN